MTLQPPPEFGTSSVVTGRNRLFTAGENAVYNLLDVHVLEVRLDRGGGSRLGHFGHLISGHSDVLLRHDRIDVSSGCIHPLDKIGKLVLGRGLSGGFRVLHLNTRLECLPNRVAVELVGDNLQGNVADVAYYSRELV